MWQLTMGGICTAAASSSAFLNLELARMVFDATTVPVRRV